MASTSHRARELKHVRPVEPHRFPSSEPAEEHLGQSRRHWDLCMLLALLLRRLVTPEHSYGADQFVYWNARDNRRCLAPDAFVKLGVPDEQFDSWKSWERGVPELAVEILSPSDTPEPWELPEKIVRYHELGVREVVCFDVDAPAGARLRVWDLIEGDMVERVVENERTPCLTLGFENGAGYELVIAAAPSEKLPAALRIAHDGELIPLDSEAYARAAQERDAVAEERDAVAHERDAIVQERDAIAHERDVAAQEREVALARVESLQRELRALREGG